MFSFCSVARARQFSLLRGRRADGLASGVLRPYAGRVHVEGEAARVAVARRLGACDVRLSVGRGRDDEAVARSLRAEYVGGDEGRVNERLEVAVDALVLQGVGDLGGLYAL